MDSSEFDTATALSAAQALQTVLARRVHRRKVLGQIVTIPGQLGGALRLPQMIGLLQARQAPRRQAGLEAFVMLWDTLSQPTRTAVLRELGWYDPKSLDWDDPRSNRLPTLPRNE
ncbi:MAG: hypothetical protein LPK85_11460 [Gammaproteobacteria bacterium]|nr:hypothetical protein [Gammaproteobacteria bacterium]